MPDKRTGTGKSSVITAVLWHLFQHASSHLVVVTSYAWKAAQLISTPANPGFSSHTTFGISTKNVESVGHSAWCQAIFNRGVVMVIDDEISFTPKNHFQVSAVVT
jgi:hypothetical protein